VPYALKPVLNCRPSIARGPLAQQARFLNRACGLVGYPNVGKSTLFNAFAGSSIAKAENFPFCTIDPNVVKVGVPDARIHQLAETCRSAKVVPGEVEIRDIAGLIKGASGGAGMGNAFLSHIRGVQVVLHVVRCFSDADVVHVEDPVNIDPVREYESVLEELIIADLEVATKRLPQMRKRALNNRDMEQRLPTYEAVLKALQDGHRASVANTDIEQSKIWPTDDFLSQLITAKPTIVLANVGLEDSATGNQYTDQLAGHLKQSSVHHSKSASTASPSFTRCLVVSAPLEAEVTQIDDPEFLHDYLESYGLTTSERVLPRILSECQQLLHLVPYFTVGDIEAKAWFVPKGSRSHEAAGAIHSDFVRNFVHAEIWSVEGILKMGSKLAAQKAGLTRIKGKDYEVQDGDVIEFLVKNAKS